MGAAEVAVDIASGVGFVRLFVAEDRCRRGVGTTLLAAATGLARRRGWVALRATVVAGSPGEAFARRAGARTLLRLAVLALRLRAAGAPVAGSARVLPAGVELVRWRGGAPDPLVAGYAAGKRMILDAPEASVQVSTASWDVAGVRAWEAATSTNPVGSGGG